MVSVVSGAPPCCSIFVIGGAFLFFVLVMCFTGLGLHLVVCIKVVSMGHFFFKDFIYLFMRERERDRQREKQAPCREPDVGLDPRSPGSHLGLQVTLNHCAPPGLPPLTNVNLTDPY